jgi:hypothetical protein
MMMKRMIVIAGLLLLMVTVIGIASASEETFWEYYTQRYIEKFGEDKYTLVNTPLDAEMYISKYIEMHGEDKYALVNNPIPLENSPASRWEEKHEAALARMPTVPSWDERHKNVTSRMTPSFPWNY